MADSVLQSVYLLLFPSKDVQMVKMNILMHKLKPAETQTRHLSEFHVHFLFPCSS